MSKTIKFKTGDLVILKSGGPVMTVEGDSRNFQGEFRGYNCQWFAGKKLDHGIFQPESLEIAPNTET